MGNCIPLFFSRPHGEARVLFDGGEEEFDTSTPIKRIVMGSDRHRDLLHSPFPLRVKPEPDEVLYIVPDVGVEQGRCSSFSINVDNRKKCTNDFVKIIVTKQELKSILLLQNGKGMASEDITVRFLNKFCLGEECEKWRPSLATIPEVQNF